MPECLCVADHRPAALSGEVHHIWPKGMGGPDVEANRVYLCSTAHTNAHDILRYMVKDQKYLSYKQVQALYPQPVNRYAFQIALLGFRRWKNGTLVAPSELAAPREHPASSTTPESYAAREGT